MILRHSLRNTTLGFSFALALAPLALAACGGEDVNIVSGSTTSAGSGGNGAGGDATSTGTITGGTGGDTTTGSGSGTGGGSGARVCDGKGGTIEPGEPITAPAEKWTWVPFDDAFCANGSTTGIGVNLTDKSKNVVIFLMGGGACWDYLTCYLAGTASNLNGYGEDQFNSDASSTLAGSIFDRTDADNPVKDYSYVFVPYCTGDVHAGNMEQTYNGKVTKHVGFANMTAFLKRIVPTFAGASNVILSGSSAGGFGAGMNWWRVQDAFGKTCVDMLDDSGTPLEDPYLPKDREATWRMAWGLDAALPPDCTGCKTSLASLMFYYGDKYTKQRSALLSYTQDNVISAFYGISPQKFEEGLQMITPEYEGKAGFRYFYVAGSSHVLLTDTTLATKSGTTLKQWLTQMVSGDAKWSNETAW